MNMTTSRSFHLACGITVLAACACNVKAGIEITNGRVASTSCLLFLSTTQEKEAEGKTVTLSPNQTLYLTVASRLDHCARTTITNLKILSIEEARRIDTKNLFNVAVRLTNDVIDVPFYFLGGDLTERDKLRKTLLYSETSSSSLGESVLEDRQALWFALRYRITGQLCQYYLQHPERFRHVGKDEEVEIDGFADFISKDEMFEPKIGGYQIHKGTIYDPWGEPVHFVKNRNGDGEISARGFKHIIMWQRVDSPGPGLNEKEQLGVCKHSAKGFEDAPHNCIYVDAFTESDWSKQKRLNSQDKKK